MSVEAPVDAGPDAGVKAPARPTPPAPDWLAAYPADAGAGDLYRGAAPAVAGRWGEVVASMARLSHGDAGLLREQLGRQIQELGLTYRVTGDAEERDWPLTPMPLLIGAEEWATVESGLIQRARLLEAVATDIYGPQTLIRDGHLPAAAIAGSPYFSRAMVGLKPLAGHFLHVYAVDLARGPHGQWRVLADRLRTSNGVGYALENRLAISRGLGPLLGDAHARRLSGFFADMRAGIAGDCPRETPRIALLTPGRMNQSHSEQAYLARYLGFPLVEGRDLMVQEDRLYLRTVAGPKRIDALWRWIDTTSLDPLTFDARSGLGVPDLFSAWARGGLEMANWPGVEVMESKAMAAFLPRLFGLLLDEEPLLPNIATWWCGQSAEADEVRERFDDVVIAPAFGSVADALAGRTPVAGASLTPARRAALLAAMARRPMDYCAQEIVRLSTTPALIGDTLAPRPFTLRAFVARDGEGNWTVMPGGFARLSSSADLLTSLMGDGDLSADVWIVDDTAPPRPAVATLASSPRIRRGGGILASQTADNLFWFGRYTERAEITLRLLRAILGSSIESDEGVSASLVRLLVQWGTIDAATATLPLARLCARALAETRLPGGVAALLRSSQNAGLSLRQRFARDFWRIASRPMAAIKDEHPQALLHITRDLIERLSALAGQVSENMMRGPAFVFLDIGRRLERAVAICRVARHLVDTAEGDTFNALLELCDCQVTYRSRYLTAAMRLPVLDLVILDPDNPRSLVYQVALLCDHITGLPHMAEDNVPEPALLNARRILAPLQVAAAEDIDAAWLERIEKGLLTLSDTLSTRYFLPEERPDEGAAREFLA